MIGLDLMSYYNMDGRHETTAAIKKRRLEAPKCAQPLSVRNNFGLEVSLCSNIQVFSVGNPSHITPTREGLGRVSQLMILADSKLRKKRICKIILSTILENNLQIQDNETYFSETVM